MIKKIFATFDSDIKKKFSIYLILSIIFVFVEVSLVGSLYPIFQNFFSENSKDLIILVYLNNIVDVSNQDTLLIIVFTLVVFRFFYFIFFNLYKNLFLQDLQKKIAEKIFKNFFITKTYNEFVNYNSSILIRDLVNESQTFKKFINVVISLIVELLLILSFSLFLLIVSPKIFFYSAFFLFSIGIIYFIFLKTFLTNLGAQRIVTIKDIIGNISEAFRFFEIIKIQKKLNFFSNKNTENYKRLKNILVKTNVLQIIPRIIVETLFFLLIVLSIYLISKSTNIKTELSVLGIFFVSFLRIYPSFIRIINSIQDLNLFKKSVDGIYHQIKNKINKPNKKNKKLEIEIKDYIEIKNFSLKYKSKYIFKKFNLKIKKNSFNAIIGKSGSGKSTLIKSILGLIKPEKAKVIVDKNIIKFREMNELFRQNVGYASQNNLVLNSSLLQNITLEENIDQLTERQLIKLKKVFLESGLEQFFNFKNDLEKLITEDGKNISGGQLQRISLARALYFSNGILVLDEICSSLDISSEKKIIEILKKLSYNHMIIYITHRENFFKEFNQVIKID